MKEELIGLSEISSDIIKCGDCGMKLADLVLTETNEARVSRGLSPLVTQYQIVGCPSCGGSSFKTRTYEGSVIYGSQHGDHFIDAEDYDVEESGNMFVKLALRKNQNVKN